VADSLYPSRGQGAGGIEAPRPIRDFAAPAEAPWPAGRHGSSPRLRAV